uniref:Uncharacterized protein n=1 Tax=Anguilla anguilla TaxID=7936 RepID=A0A0E9X2R9_ANGAN
MGRASLHFHVEPRGAPPNKEYTEIEGRMPTYMDTHPYFLDSFVSRRYTQALICNWLCSICRYQYIETGEELHCGFYAK